MSLEYIRIPVKLYRDKTLCPTQRALLSLAAAFGKEGLKMSDSELSATLGKSRQWISRCINLLAGKNYIDINKNRSRYRVIYCKLHLTETHKQLSTPDDSRSLCNGSTVNLTLRNCQHNLTHNINNIKNKEEEEDTGFYKSFTEYWNSKSPLPKIRKLTTRRKNKLARRMREQLFSGNWKDIIDKLSDSGFCTGDNERGWRADVDWILKNETNYVKVLEGRYDDKPTSAESAAERAKRLWEQEENAERGMGKNCNAAE